MTIDNIAIRLDVTEMLFLFY